jgi:hydrogenase maturation protease
MESGKIIVIGIGNEFRGDDAAGLLVVRRLQEKPPAGVEFWEQSGEATALMDTMNRAGTVILVDAVQSGAEAGQIHRYDASEQSMPAQFLRCSTHNFSVHDAIEMARALGKLPPRLMVYGIEGSHFEPGAELSPAVQSAVVEVTQRINEELQSLMGIITDA